MTRMVSYLIQLYAWWGGDAQELLVTWQAVCLSGWKSSKMVNYLVKLCVWWSKDTCEWLVTKPSYVLEGVEMLKES